MHSSSLSPAQGCLRLQSVYRAHCTRRCVLQRSRLEFERILAQLEPEPSRPRVVFPLPFMCRPHIEPHSAPPPAFAPASSTRNDSTPLVPPPPSSSCTAEPAIRLSPLQVIDDNPHAASTSVRGMSPSSSSPAYHSPIRDNHNRTTAADHDHPDSASLSVCVGVGTGTDDSNWKPAQPSSQIQHQSNQGRTSSSCDVAVQSIPLFVDNATADACVGNDNCPSPTSFQQRGGSSLRGSAACHDDSFEEDARLGESSSSSPYHGGSCENSQLSNSAPISPFFDEQLRIAENSRASPRTFGMRRDQSPSPPLSSGHSSSSSSQVDENSVMCHRVSLSADNSFDSNHFPSPPPSPPASLCHPASPLSLDALSPLPPPPYASHPPSFQSSADVFGGLSPPTSLSDLNCSNSSAVSNSSKRSLDAIMAAASLSTSRAMPQSPAKADAAIFDPCVLINPPLSPAVAASMSPLEKASMKDKLQKDLEWTQLMLQQRLVFLKQQQQKTP